MNLASSASGNQDWHVRMLTSFHLWKLYVVIIEGKWEKLYLKFNKKLVEDVEKKEGPRDTKQLH